MFYLILPLGRSRNLKLFINFKACNYVKNNYFFQAETKKLDFVLILLILKQWGETTFQGARR